MTYHYAMGHPSVTIEEIDRQRRLGWPDFHPEDYCHRCGGRNLSWFVDSDRWNDALLGNTEYNGILCPGCFVLLHEAATGMKSTWRLVPSVAAWMTRGET